MSSVPQLWLYLPLLATHWLGDFVLQTNCQAANKSKNNIALSQHVLVYTGCLAATSAILFGLNKPWLLFTVGNGLLHFATDYCTSRWSARLFAEKDWHKFFIVVGFDQLIHQTTLAATMWFIFYL